MIHKGEILALVPKTASAQLRRILREALVCHRRRTWTTVYSPAAARRSGWAPTCSSPARACPAWFWEWRSARTCGRSSPPLWPWPEAGATVILNLSASDEVVGKADYRRHLVTGQSARLVCGYVYADAGEGESTTDLVFAGHNMIAENGALLARAALCHRADRSARSTWTGWCYERRRMTTLPPPTRDGAGRLESVSFALEPSAPRRSPAMSPPRPFVPEDERDRARTLRRDPAHRRPGPEAAAGAHPAPQAAVVGLSGGLDSTLAILITAMAMTLLDRPGQRHHRGDHALLRHHRPHPGQRRGAWPSGWGPPCRRIDIGEAVQQPLQGHRPVHGRPRRDL